MMHGDTAWSLIASLSQSDALVYLDDRRNRGFNTILVSLLEHKFAQNAPANVYGNHPFLSPGDYTTPNESYFSHADWVIQQAESRGLLVLLTPSYIGYIGSDEGWYTEMVANGAAKLRAYGRYLATRFAARRNILWVHAGDDNPPDKSVVRAIADGIRDVDAATLHTVHCGIDTSGLQYWSGETWLAVNTVYTRSNISAATATEYERSQQMPVFFIEGSYEDEACCGPRVTEEGLRRQAFHSVLSGAFGHVFGNNPMWHFAGPGLSSAPTDWRGALNSRGVQTMSHFRTILYQANWPTLVPDLSNAYLASGLGAGDARAVAAVGSDRRAALAYVPTQRAITVNLARLSGPRVSLKWFDPSNGDYAAIDATPVSNSGSRTLTPPAQNAAGYADWVLLAESVV
jgi:hypothetical protein